MTIRELLEEASWELVDACERPRFEAELLLAYYLKQERLYLFTHDTKQVVAVAGYRSLVARRKAHEPYEYIVGEASFYDITLAVEAGVLIPRPETEILIDLVATIIRREKIEQIVEIGVGSGAISIVLARHFPQLQIIATDICDTPLRVAKENVRRLGVAEQITLRKSNLMDEVSEAVSLVVSNPPYIAEDFLLKPNVVDYEPKEALFGGRVGDELLKQIILDSHAKGVRYLACEMGYDQKAPIEAFVKELGVQSIHFYHDLSGFDRGFVIDFFASRSIANESIL